MGTFVPCEGEQIRSVDFAHPALARSRITRSKCRVLSIQRVTTGIGKHGHVIPHFDQSQIGQRVQVSVAYRRQHQPLALNVPQHPTQRDPPLKAEVGKGIGFVGHDPRKVQGPGLVPPLPGTIRTPLFEGRGDQSDSETCREGLMRMPLRGLPAPVLYRNTISPDCAAHEILPGIFLAKRGLHLRLDCRIAHQESRRHA
jgi:hypothetical protein